MESMPRLEQVVESYAAMSDEELHEYWSRKNVTSIGGLPTGIFEDCV